MLWARVSRALTDLWAVWLGCSSYSCYYQNHCQSSERYYYSGQMVESSIYFLRGVLLSQPELWTRVVRSSGPELPRKYVWHRYSPALAYFALIRQAAASAVVFHLTHMVLSVCLKWILVQRLPEAHGVYRTTSWLGIRKQVAIASERSKRTCEGV